MAAEVDALVGAANEAIRRGDAETAAGALERLVALMPGNPALRRQCSIAGKGSRDGNRASLISR